MPPTHTAPPAQLPAAPPAQPPVAPPAQPPLAPPARGWRICVAGERRSANLDAIIARIATTQHGVVARRQLLAAGLSRGAIDRRARDGRLVRLHLGVYAVAHTGLRSDGYRLAAVLACGPGAVLSHRSAAEAHGLLTNGRRRHDVTITQSAGRGLRTVDVHRNRLAASDVTILDGVPVTTVARTLLDVAAVESRRRLQRAIEQSELNETFDLVAIDAVLARAGPRAGARALRAAVAAFCPSPHFTRSWLEELGIIFATEYGLPPMRVNGDIGGAEADFHWPEARLNVEFDGWETHRTRTAYERDRARDRRLTATGYRVVRVTAAQLRHDRDAVAADISTLLASPPPRVG